MPATPEEKADKSLHRILETDSDVSESENEIDSDEADDGRTDYRYSKRNARTTSKDSEKLITQTTRSMSHTSNQESNNKKSDGIYLPGAKITAYATSIF